MIEISVENKEKPPIRAAQSVKKLPLRPLFLYNEEKGAFTWKSGEKMRGEKHLS